MRSTRYKMNYTVDSKSGLFFVDYDNFNIYQSITDKFVKKKRWKIPDDQLDYYELDVNASQANYNRWLVAFRYDMPRACPSLQYNNYQKYYQEHVLLGNSCFDIQIEDDGWACAVELIAKPDGNKSRQKTEFPEMYHRLGEVLLKNLDTIYIRTGSWQVQPVTKNTLDSVIDNVKETDMEDTHADGNIPTGPDV